MSIIPDKSYPVSLFKTPGQNLLRDESAFAVSLLVLAADVLGDDEDPEEGWMSWTPATIAISLAEAIGVTPLDENFAKLFAAIQLSKDDRFYTDPATFLELANGLIGGVTFGVPSVRETNWAILEASLIAPSPTAEEGSFVGAFSPEIKAYLHTLCVGQGYAPAPAILRQAMSPLVIEDPSQFLTSDPEMYEAFASTKFNASIEIDQVTTEELLRAVDQLDKLVLSEKKSEENVKKLTARLRDAVSPKTDRVDLFGDKQMS
jgi:hypothetical protein